MVSRLQAHLDGPRGEERQQTRDALRGLGGPGREHEAHDERLAWNRHLAAHGWTCIGWPTEHGGRGLSLMQQVIFHEEYARADAPARVNHLGEELLGRTTRQVIRAGVGYVPEDRSTDGLVGPFTVAENLVLNRYDRPPAGNGLQLTIHRIALAGMQVHAGIVGTRLARHGQALVQASQGDADGGAGLGGGHRQRGYAPATGVAEDRDAGTGDEARPGTAV